MGVALASSAQVKAQAHALGFTLVGITPAQPSPTLWAYERWLAAGMHAEMDYMARPDRLARRRDLRAILPNVRSLVVVGVDYRAVGAFDALLNDPMRGRIASYAWGLDYHDLLTPRLRVFAEWLAGLLAHDHAEYVDTGALLERSHAQQAGLGFIGKNTMLIHPRRGSYVVLGEMLTSAAFDAYDTPHRATMCGTCARCLHACPTNAFPQPYVLDARRCISYHTIENKGHIPEELRPQFGNWVFGCDVCQDVCPFQRFAAPTQEAAFVPADVWRIAPPLVDLLALDDEAFAAHYRGTPIYRAKRARFVRNACIAAGNSGEARLLPALASLREDTNPLVREAAAWAVERLTRREPTVGRPLP